MKKIIAMTMVAILVLTAAIGGTMAYLTDTDAAVNTFVVGDVQIDLWEDFGDNDGFEKLVPATGSAQDGSLQNGVNKEVYVTNTGNEDAYVRVHIAIPQLLDDGAETFDASTNILHFNFDKESVGENKWDWSKTTGPEYTGDWNYYEMTLTNDGKEIVYNVYVVTYDKALAPGEITVDAINQVYMDSDVTADDIVELRDALGDEWHIYVAAEAIQAAGFSDAYTALNEGFGVPGTYTVDWNAVQGHSYVPTADETTLIQGGTIIVTDPVTLVEPAAILKQDTMLHLANDITANRGDTTAAEKYSTLTVASNVEIDGEGTIKNEAGYAITVKDVDDNGASLTIFGGEYVGSTTAINVVKGELIIHGGVFMDTNTEDNGHYLINCIDANYRDGSAKVTIDGGQFMNWNPMDNTSEGAGTNFVAENHTVIEWTDEDGNTWYEVVPADAVEEAPEEVG